MACMISLFDGPGRTFPGEPTMSGWRGAAATIGRAPGTTSAAPATRVRYVDGP
jgi:hypothetical protein